MFFATLLLLNKNLSLVTRSEASGIVEGDFGYVISIGDGDLNNVTQISEDYFEYTNRDGDVEYICKSTTEQAANSSVFCPLQCLILMLFGSLLFWFLILGPCFSEINGYPTSFVDYTTCKHQSGQCMSIFETTFTNQFDQIVKQKGLPLNEKETRNLWKILFLNALCSAELPSMDVYKGLFNIEKSVLGINYVDRQTNLLLQILETKATPEEWQVIAEGFEQLHFVTLQYPKLVFTEIYHFQKIKEAAEIINRHAEQEGFFPIRDFFEKRLPCQKYRWDQWHFQDWLDWELYQFKTPFTCYHKKK